MSSPSPASSRSSPNAGGHFSTKANKSGRFNWWERTGCLAKSNTSPKSNVLPVRHVLVLRDKTAGDADIGEEDIKNVAPAWVQDYALFLLDADGMIAAWYAGAERIYGYRRDEVIGRTYSVLLSR